MEGTGYLSFYLSYLARAHAELRRKEPRPPLARSGQGAASARTVGPGLRVVYGGFHTRGLKQAKALPEEPAA